MGTATNQIATEKDLYYSGFTNFANGASGSIGVTYGDIWDRSDSTTTKGVKTFQILPTLGIPVNNSITLSAPSGSYQYSTIATYDLSSINNFNSITFIKDAPIGLTVKNNGSTTATVQLYLKYGSTTKTVKTLTLNAGTLNQNITSCLHAALGQSIENFTTNILKNINNLYWEIGVKNGSVTVTNNYTQSQMNIQCYTRTQLVKYSNIGGKDNPYYVTWRVKISEEVTSSTAANKIELRYYYTVDGTYDTDGYKVIGSWDNNTNINGSAEADIEVNINPYNIYGSNTLPKYAWLEIWCGSTKNNQTWSYKMRNKSTNTWQSSYIVPDWGFDYGTYCKLWFDKNGNEINSIPLDDAVFLQCMNHYNGIEFHIK